jgi:aminomethyltransferase
MELLKTPFYQKHLQNKGKTVDFAGWALPVEYKSMLAEAGAVRKSCGLFDASHMGELAVRGRDAFLFLQRLTSNDLSVINAGQMQYNLFLNQNGGVIDDLMVYRRQASFLCVVNASNKAKVFKWLTDNIREEAEVIDQSSQLALISLQGPQAAGIAGKVFTEAVAALEYLSFVEIEADSQKILISRSGYTGEDGFEIYLPWEESGRWWDRLIEAGSDSGLIPCGLGSRDILRIEAGYPLYGHEIDETTDPFQASLGWAVKLDKDFIGKAELFKKKGEGLKKKRVGFIMRERAMPRQGYTVHSISEVTPPGAEQRASSVKARIIGEVSSGTYSPNLGKFIGMAFLEKAYAQPGCFVNLKVRDKFYKAEIVKVPFVNINTKSVNSADPSKILRVNSSRLGGIH